MKFIKKSLKLQIFIFLTFFAGLIGLIQLSMISPVYAEEVSLSEPVGYINDFENIIEEGVESELNNFLAGYDEESGREIVVLTTDNFSDTYIEEYATSVYSQWSIVEEGILIIVSAEKRESRIEVGYGLQSELTDAETGRIQDDYMIPHFQDGNYSEGISEGVYAVVEGIGGEVEPVKNEESGELPDWVGVIASVGIFVLILLFDLGIFILRWLGSSKSWWMGGVLGVVIGLLLSFFFLRWWSIILFPSMLGVMGLVLDLILSKLGFGRDWKRKGRSFWNPVGRSRSSSFFSSGSSGGSSFGGFSGGSRGSGGGGSSRSW